MGGVRQARKQSCLLLLLLLLLLLRLRSSGVAVARGLHSLLAQGEDCPRWKGGEEG